MVQEEAAAAAMRNHQLQVPPEVVAKQVVAREVLAKGLVLTQRLVAKGLVLTQTLAVPPRMRLVRVARLSAEDVLGVHTRHISLMAKQRHEDCWHIDESALFPHSVWKC